MKTTALSAFLVTFFYSQTVIAGALNQDLSPSLIAQHKVPTRTREKRDTQVSCDSLYGYPPPAACEAAIAMLPTDAPNLFGLLGPADIGFFSFEPHGRTFFMLDQEGDNGNIWAAGNCIIRLRLRHSLIMAAQSETSTWTKVRAKVQDILDRCVTTLPSTGGYARLGNGANWDELREPDIPGTGNLEIYVFSPWSRYDTGEQLSEQFMTGCLEAQSEHHSLPDYCTASLQSSEYCTGGIVCHTGTSCRDSKIKQDTMGILFGAAIQAGKDFIGTCVDSVLLE